MGQFKNLSGVKRERRSHKSAKPEGFSLGVAVILATVFWAGVVALIVYF